MDNIITKFQSYISRMWFKYFAIFIVGICISQAVGWTLVSAFDFPNPYKTLPVTINGIIYDSVISQNSNILYFNNEDYTVDEHYNSDLQIRLVRTGTLNNYYFYNCNIWTNHEPTQCDGQSANFDMIFTFWKSTTEFYFSSLIPSCEDGIMNRDETAIDWGGICGDDMHLDFVEPIYNSTTANANFNVIFDYRLPSTYTDVTQITLKLCPLSYTADDCRSYNVTGSDVHRDENVQQTLSVTGVTLLGEYQATLSFNNGQEDYWCSWYAFWCEDTRNVQYDVTQTYFNIQYVSGTNGIPTAKSPISYNQDTSSLVTAECSLGDFGCYATFLFGVNQSILSKFSTLTLSNSIPFSYIYDIGNIFNELFANSGSQTYAVSAHTSLGDINFISSDMISSVPYSSTIKTILGWLIYFFTAMSVYRIVLNTFSSKHTS